MSKSKCPKYLKGNKKVKMTTVYFLNYHQAKCLSKLYTEVYLFGEREGFRLKIIATVILEYFFLFVKIKPKRKSEVIQKCS